MVATIALSDSIYHEKVMRARAASIEEKLLDGPRLFAYACEAVRAGIRAQHPDASSEQVAEMLKARFQLMRKLEEVGRG